MKANNFRKSKMNSAFGFEPIILRSLSQFLTVVPVNRPIHPKERGFNLNQTLTLLQCVRIPDVTFENNNLPLENYFVFNN